MADVDQAPLEEVVPDMEPETEPEKSPPALCGLIIAYVALLVMALLPIWFGAKRSAANRIKKLQDKAEGKITEDDLEVISSKDAAKFPIVASIALFSIYTLYKYFADKMYYVVTGYFFLLGIVAVTAILEPVIAPKLNFIFPGCAPDADYQLHFTENKKTQFDLKFTRKSLVVLALGVVNSLAYLYNQHWIANNVIGLCFAIQGVELLSLPNYKTGAMLLGGLFFYDVFWVFGTDVMVTVAKKFDAPIKLVFPQDIFDTTSRASMLGLGDIVIPGILIALMLRYDASKNNGSQFYFLTTFFAYIAGLVCTIFVMHVYKHAQPALLYLVPACLGAPLVMSIVKGDLMSMLAYDEEEPEEEAKKTEVKEAEVKKDE
jgi:minor histocompatibility antigen H13